MPKTTPQRQSVYLKEVQPSATGTPLATTAYSTRNLNTLENPIGYAWVTLASNQFTLQAGTYEIEAYPEVYSASSYHKAKLYNVTDATDTLHGSSAASPGNAVVVTSSIIKGRFTIASAKVFEIRHRATTTNGSFGQATSLDTEVHCVTKITRLAG